MSDLIKRLRALAVCDTRAGECMREAADELEARNNADPREWVRSGLLDDLQAEIARLRARLEIDYAFRFDPNTGESERIPFPEGMPDGIESRDATIDLLEEEIARLRAAGKVALYQLVILNGVQATHICADGTVVKFRIDTSEAIAALKAVLPVPGQPVCVVCGKTDLSTVEGDGGTECEISEGRWVCSPECYDCAVPAPEARAQGGTDR